MRARVMERHLGAVHGTLVLCSATALPCDSRIDVRGQIVLQ